MLFLARKGRKRAVWAGKGFTFFIPIKGYLFISIVMNDIFTIIKSLDDSGLLIDEVTGIAKHEIKNKKVDFLEPC